MSQSLAATPAISALLDADGWQDRRILCVLRADTLWAHPHFLSSVLFSPLGSTNLRWGTWFANEQTFAQDDKPLTGTGCPLLCFIAVSGPHVRACSAAAARVGRCGLCPLVTLVQQTSPARQLQLHPLQAHAASSVNHAYAACKTSPAIDKPRAFIGKQTLVLL